MIADGDLTEIVIPIDLLAPQSFYRVKKSIWNLEGNWTGKGYMCWGNLDNNGNPILLDEGISIFSAVFWCRFSFMTLALPRWDHEPLHEDILMTFDRVFVLLLLRQR